MLLDRAGAIQAAGAARDQPSGSCAVNSARPPPPATRNHPGLLEIPALGVVAPVLPGLGNSVLAVAVGHDPATVWPGARGESLLLAHDVSYFSGLARAQPGELVSVTLGCVRAVFRVTDAFVSQPGALIAAPRSGFGLALITCWPTNALFWTSQRYVVQTQLVDVALVSAPTAPAPEALVQLRVPAPPGLVALGLSLARSGVGVGTLTITGTPLASFREGPEPLIIANAALRADAAAAKTAEVGERSWWSALALPGVPLPAAWSLGAATDVTISVSGVTASRVVLSSPGVSLTLVVRNGELLVARVASSGGTARG